MYTWVDCVIHGVSVRLQNFILAAKALSWVTTQGLAYLKESQSLKVKFMCCLRDKVQVNSRLKEKLTVPYINRQWERILDGLIDKQ